MAKAPTIAMVPTGRARTRLGSLLKQVERRKTRFVITRSGKPAAVLLAVTDFDDLLEERDPEFQRSLRRAAQEFRNGKATRLSDYRKARSAARRAG
ncbi:MAG: type II toxin-antitoxin system Phd/YefM family antitoxin [Nitrospira sp.]|nr:type II toxin-antitoxin system Phd/YefM family antitoxin [Nitrospira sp.]